jgi:hypothetical protein
MLVNESEDGNRASHYHKTNKPMMAVRQDGKAQVKRKDYLQVKSNNAHINRWISLHYLDTFRSRLFKLQALSAERSRRLLNLHVRRSCFAISTLDSMYLVES